MKLTRKILAPTRKMMEAARETAETLIEEYGHYGAAQYVRRAMRATPDDPAAFWSRVWDALQCAYEPIKRPD